MLPLNSIKLHVNPIGVERVTYKCEECPDLDAVEKFVLRALPSRHTRQLKRPFDWTVYRKNSSKINSIRKATHPSLEHAVDTPQKTLDSRIIPGLIRADMRDRIANFFVKKKKEKEEARRKRSNTVECEFANMYYEFDQAFPDFTKGMSMERAFALAEKYEVKPHGNHLPQIEPRADSNVKRSDCVSSIMNLSMFTDFTDEQRQEAIKRVNNFLART